jgi:hypothetical protein
MYSVSLAAALFSRKYVIFQFEMYYNKTKDIAYHQPNYTSSFIGALIRASRGKLGQIIMVSLI